MARSFTPYVPTKLILTPEDLAKVPAGAKVHYNLNKTKQKGGYTYVMERAYYIDPKTGMTTPIASVKIGIIPKGETQMIEAPGKKVKSKRAPAPSALTELTERVDSVLADERQAGKVTVPISAFWAVYLLCALTGRTDAVSVSDYWARHWKTLTKHFKNVELAPSISPDTVLRLMSFLNVEQSYALANLFTRQCLEKDEESVGVVAIDGQAVRASRNEDDRCNYILNLFNCTQQQFLGQCLISSKKAETSTMPELLKMVEIDGTIVTADALFSKACVLEAILQKGADYCIVVKDNAKLVVRSIDEAFKLADCASEDSDTHSAKCYVYEYELGHGRIEKREVYVLPGALLPEKLRKRWPGLDEGCIVQYCTRRINKKTGEVEHQIRRHVSSVRWDSPDVAKTLAVVVRKHWAIENELHWVLDVAFRQDRIQCKNGDYLYARTWVNKMALNLLRHYKAKTKSSMSIERIMVEMQDPKVGIKCLAMALI